MGLDLLFRPRAGKAPTERDFFRHFEGRENFERDGSRVEFHDGGTGAQFQFFRGDFRDDRKRGPLGRPWASFYMNYIRPGWLPYQAIPEIAALCEAFDLTCEHVDSAPGQVRDFDDEALFLEWTDGNEQSIRHMVMLEATEGHREAGEVSQLDDHYPEEPLWKYWQWNWSRGEGAVETEDGMFVPAVCYVRRAGRVESAVLWPEGIPMLLPKVDTVLFLRRAADVAGGDFAEALRPADFAAVAPLIDRFRTSGEPIAELYAVNDEATSAALREIAEKIPVAPPGALDLLDPGLVLEREKIDAARDAQARGDDGDGNWKTVRVVVKRDSRH